MAGDRTLGGAGGLPLDVGGAPGEIGSQAPLFRAGGGGGGGAVDRSTGAGGVGGAGGNSVDPVPPMLVAAPGGNGGAAGNAGIAANGVIQANVVGGSGANGGDAPGIFLDAAGGGGGGGGEGGIGAWVPSGATAAIAIGTAVQGGVGGQGGRGGASNDGGEETVGSGGAAGDGGIGIYVSPGAQVTNLGVVEGGRGGTGGGIGGKIVIVEKPAVAGGGGAGGVGIEAEGGTIFNSGTVRGGIDAAGTSRSAAIFFRSGTSLLELRAGSNIDGLIHIGGGANARIFAAAPGQKIFGGLLVDGAGILDSGTQVLEVNSTIRGAGSLDIQGSGTVLLSAPANFVGVTTVAGGTFRAGAANVFAPASPHTVLASGILETGGFNQTLQSLDNAGLVSLFGSAPGSTLTVTNAYVGNGGTLRLGTTLGGSSSPSDRLVLDGPAASASGSTQVEIRNIGGLGALTSGNGIEVISGINGAKTTAQTTQGAFRLAGDHVDAGAFEYRLHAADADGQGENWYLRSTVAVPTLPLGNSPNPANPFDPRVPTNPFDPASPGFSPELVAVFLGAGLGNTGFGLLGLPLAANSAGFNQVPAYRIEAGLLSSLPQQLRQSGFAMLGNLHRRIGDLPASAAEGERMAWARAVRVQPDLDQAGTVHPRSSGSLSGLQVGTDLLATKSWRAGLYVGQLEGSMKVTGFARGVEGFALGENDLRNEYLGGYATWRDGGYYADAVVQFGRHRYTIAPNEAFQTHGRGSSALASLEVGRSFDISNGWRIEPQAQLVHERSRLDDLEIPNAGVHQDTGSTWMARLGLRIVGDLGWAGGRLKPYAGLNFHRTPGRRDVAVFSTASSSTPIAADTGSTTSEVTLGFTHELSDAVGLYGELGWQRAVGGSSSAASSWLGGLGLRVKW